MRNFFKVFVLGLVLGLVAVSATVSTYAQTNEKAELYQKYTDNYAGTIEERKVAVQAAKDYIKKFGGNEEDKAMVDYMKSAIPQLEQGIKEEEEADRQAELDRQKNERYQRFNTAVTAKNWDAAYTSGQDILTHEPEMIDVILVLGSLGLDETLKNPPINKYNDATIKYAKMAIDKLNSGANSKKFGAYNWEYDTRDNALAWMKYTIGMIEYLRQGQNSPAVKRDGVINLYETTKYNWDKKDEPRVYGVIGDWYFDKALDVTKQGEDMIKANKDLLAKRNAADAAAQPEMDKQIDANEAKIENTVNLAKAYADRSLDAYARALQLARKNPKETTQYKDNLSARIKQLFDFRYNKPEDKTDTKINSYIVGVMATPMPNPASEVSPVPSTKPATTSAKVSTGAVQK
ncbi:MAG: hypothetical protein ACK5NT_08380 [Pyrinomonadaceae bacterium]